MSDWIKTSDGWKQTGGNGVSASEVTEIRESLTHKENSIKHFDSWDDYEANKSSVTNGDYFVVDDVQEQRTCVNRSSEVITHIDGMTVKLYKNDCNVCFLRIGINYSATSERTLLAELPTDCACVDFAYMSSNLPLSENYCYITGNKVYARNIGNVAGGTITYLTV